MKKYISSKLPESNGQIEAFCAADVMDMKVSHRREEEELVCIATRGG